jgi:uncharacterized ParB-like nuclease family protein
MARILLKFMLITQVFDKVTPPQIDVLLVDGKYYGFSGCHRFEVKSSHVIQLHHTGCKDNSLILGL